MSVFVDTSALLATLVEGDQQHAEAAASWRQLNERRETLVTTNYVLLELLALLQRRHGMEAVRAAVASVALVVDVHWVSPEQHDSALAAMLALDRRDLSLVDCVSFVAMRELGITTAFALDRDFAEHGFDLIP